jgi:ribosomal-protein-alanine N-acetyltransferase
MGLDRPNNTGTGGEKNMPRKEKYDRKVAAEKLGKVIKTFGDSLSEILDDPQLRTKAREFSLNVVDSVAKVVNSKIKDDEVRAKIKDVGKAAQDLGKSIADHFDTTV